MTPRRLVETDDARARWLVEAARVEPQDSLARAQGRRALLSRLGQREPRPARLVFAFAVALLVGVVATRWVLRPVEAVPGGEVVAVAEHTDYRPVPGGFSVASGRLEVETRASSRLVTPQLEVQVRSGRVAVSVANEASQVEVFAGEADVRKDVRVVTVAAGQLLSSDDARLDESRLHVAVPRDAACVDQACLETAAAGVDLPAQTALLRLGLRALEHRQWALAERRAHDSLTRFPAGVLEPEAHLVRLEALQHLGRAAEARFEATWYLQNQATSPMAASVALVLGDLELRAGNVEPAATAYRRALSLAPEPEVEAEAHFGVGLAEERAGHESQARAAFQRARGAAPTGPRAAEVSRRLRLGP